MGRGYPDRCYHRNTRCSKFAANSAGGEERRNRVSLGSKGNLVFRSPGMLAEMILRATVPPRSLPEVVETWPVEPEFSWNGETTGSAIELDAAQFAKTLRGRLDHQLHTARLSWGGDSRDAVSRTARFKNQAVLTLWLDQQIAMGNDSVELTEFPCVAEYPEHLLDLIFMRPDGLSHNVWQNCLSTAKCPACEIVYSTQKLREIEYDLFYCGEYVLVCPQDHHLCVIGFEVYQLGG